MDSKLLVLVSPRECPKMGSPAIRMPVGTTLLENRPMAIRVLIADDSPMGCQLLKTAFSRFRKRFYVVDCVVSSQQIIQRVSQGQPDVALINSDLQDGPLAGLRALRQIQTAGHGISVIVLFDKWEDDLIVYAFRAGARGVFCRSEEKFDLLCKCVAAVHEGQVWANSHQLQLLLRNLVKSTPRQPVDSKGLDLLSKRDAQVVELVAEGLPNKEIALKLGITEHTVSNYLFRIYNKLGISSRVELVLYVMNKQK